MASTNICNVSSLVSRDCLKTTTKHSSRGEPLEFHGGIPIFCLFRPTAAFRNSHIKSRRNLNSGPRHGYRSIVCNANSSSAANAVTEYGILVSENGPFSRPEMINLLEGSGFIVQEVSLSEIDAPVLSPGGGQAQTGLYVGLNAGTTPVELLENLRKSGFHGRIVERVVSIQELPVEERAEVEEQLLEGVAQISSDVAAPAGGVMRRWGGVWVLGFIVAICWQAWKIHTSDEREKKRTKKEGERLGRIRLRQVEQVVAAMDAEEDQGVLQRKTVFSSEEERDVYEQAWEIRRIQKQAKLIIAKEKKEEEEKKTEGREPPVSSPQGPSAVAESESESESEAMVAQQAPEVVEGEEQDSEWKVMEAEARTYLEAEHAGVDAAQVKSDDVAVLSDILRAASSLPPAEAPSKATTSSPLEVEGEQLQQPWKGGEASRKVPSQSDGETLPVVPSEEESAGKVPRKKKKRVKTVRAKDLGLKVEAEGEGESESGQGLTLSESEKAILRQVEKNGRKIDWDADLEDGSEVENILFEGLDKEKARQLFDRLAEVDRLGAKGVEKMFERTDWELGPVYRDDPIENYKPKLRKDPSEQPSVEAVEEILSKQKGEGLDSEMPLSSFSDALPPLPPISPRQSADSGSPKAREGGKEASEVPAKGPGWSNTAEWAQNLWKDDEEDSGSESIQKQESGKSGVTGSGYIVSQSAESNSDADSGSSHGKEWTKEFRRRYDEETDPEIRRLMREMGSDLPSWLSEEDLARASSMMPSDAEVDRLADQYWKDLTSRKKEEMKRGALQIGGEQGPAKKKTGPWWLERKEVVVITVIKTLDGQPYSALHSVDAHVPDKEEAEDKSENGKIPYVLAFEWGKDAYLYMMTLTKHGKYATMAPSAELIPTKELESLVKAKGWDALVLRKGQLEFKAKNEQTFPELYRQVQQIAREYHADKVIETKGMDLVDFIEISAEKEAAAEVGREEPSSRIRNPSVGKQLN